MTSEPNPSSASSAAKPDPPKAAETEPRWRRLWTSQRGNLRVLIIALVLAFLVRVCIAEPRYIPSNSMEPTLLVGDRLIVDKLSYRWRSPQFGDVVVFTPPPQLLNYGYDQGQAFIKRVIGEAGHTVQVAGGEVYLDGQPLHEPYTLEPSAYAMAPVAIPPGYVFVMGDNRNDSNDSHVWGVLPQSNIIGWARFRFWPLTRLGQVR